MKFLKKKMKDIVQMMMIVMNLPNMKTILVNQYYLLYSWHMFSN